MENGGMIASVLISTLVSKLVSGVDCADKVSSISGDGGNAAACATSALFPVAIVTTTADAPTSVCSDVRGDRGGGVEQRESGLEGEGWYVLCCATCVHIFLAKVSMWVKFVSHLSHESRKKKTPCSENSTDRDWCQSTQHRQTSLCPSHTPISPVSGHTHLPPLPTCHGHHCAGEPSLDLLQQDVILHPTGGVPSHSRIRRILVFVFNLMRGPIGIVCVLSDVASGP